MNYLNIHTDTLRSERFISAEPVQRSTWLCLSAWCATQENGGRINQCEEWGDRRWMQLAGVTKAEVHDESSPLFNFVDGDLIIHLYPVEKEQEVRRKREGGKRGGKAKTQAKTQAALTNGKKGGRPPKSLTDEEVNEQPKDKTKAEKPNENPSSPDKNPSITQACNPTERNGREGNSKGKETHPSPPPPKPPRGNPAAAGAAESKSDLEDLRGKVRGLRKAWESPKAFSMDEDRHLWENCAQLREASDEDLALLRDYLHAKHDKEKGLLVPYKRWMMIAKWGSILQDARHWAHVTGRKVKTQNPEPLVGNAFTDL